MSTSTSLSQHARGRQNGVVTCMFIGTSDAFLNHEMNPAANSAEGRGIGHNKPGTTGAVTSSEGKFDQRWENFEEYNTTHADNAYRRENGLPTRDDYSKLP
jgi:hypothetical protein